MVSLREEKQSGISDKNIPKITKDFYIHMVAKTGIRRVADDQVNLSFFQQFCTADRSAVGDFDPDIRVIPDGIFGGNELDNSGRSCHWHRCGAGL